MKGPKLSKILISIIAAFAIYLPFAGKAPELAQQSTNGQTQPPAISGSTSKTSAPRSKKSKPPEASSKIEQGQAAELLCDFFGLSATQADVTFNNRLETGKSEINRNQVEQYQVETLISTIPDPNASRLDYFFDRNLDAIQRAIEAAGYVLDRHSLPWEKAPSPAPSSSSAQSRRDFTREPGVILFRQSGPGKSRLLLLFLVGETPTAGIHKTAFRSALTQITSLPDWLLGKPTDPSLPNLRVMGPTFSGSADSLAIALKNWFGSPANKNGAQARVQIISGSATAINKDEFLARIGQPNQVSFNSVVPLDSWSQRAFINYLIETGAVEADAKRPRIAILSESNTKYGQEVIRVSEESRLTESAGTKDLILDLNFPLHISQLRSEAAKIKTPRKDQPNGLLTSSENIALPLSEGGEQKARDVVPLFSALEPASIEKVISNIFSAINREPIRYIGLFTTDVQDRIFLVRELRKHCPNTTIFIYSSDLLYLHSEANLDFQGSLVITPYPLFSLNQLWSYPFNGDRNRLQFSTQSAQGSYNATLALLKEESKMIEYGPPFDRDVNKSRRPALWLSIVGRNAIWPVKTLPYPEDLYTYTLEVSKNTKRVNERGIFVGYREHSTTSTGALLLVSLLCLVPPIILLLQLVRERMTRSPQPWGFKQIRQRLNFIKLLNRSWIGRNFNVDDQFRYDFDRRVYLLACCMSLLTISLAGTLTVLLPDWIDSKFNQYIRYEHGVFFHALAYTAFVLTLIVLVAVLIWLPLSIISWMRQPNLGRGSRMLAVFYLAISLGMFALAGIALGRHAVSVITDDKLAIEALFFFLRATDLGSGVSLLLPWIFIGLAAFLSFFSDVRRLNLAEKMYSLKDPRNESGNFEPFLNFTAPSFSGLDKLEDKVKGLVIGRIFTVPGAIVIIFLIFVPYFQRFIEQHTASVEGRRFDLFFIAAFYVVPLLLMWAFLRFCWLSLALIRLLRRLDWHPLFTTPIETGDVGFLMVPKVDLMSPTPTYTAMSASISHAKEFLTGLAEAAASNGDGEWRRISAGNLVDIEKAEKNLQKAIHAESKGQWHVALNLRRKTQHAISAVSKVIANWMEPRWIELKNGSGQSQTPIKQGRIFMMGHVAAFLQYIIVHLQNLAGLVTVGLILVLTAATSYPFQPRESLLLFGWVSILAVAALTLFIFIQLSRGKVFSLLSGTKPGELNWSRDLIYRIMVHGVIPIVALLGAQFPEAVRNIVNWLSVFGGNGN
jgi:hypothetical protein